MKPRTVLMFAVIAIVALGLAFTLAGSRRPVAQTPASANLLPGLSESLDSVNRVRIIGAGDATLATLERKDDAWSLAERGGYRVDVARLRDLLDALATARTVEAKTANPSLHARLGVEDTASADAHGVKVEIATPSASHAVIVGDNIGQGTGTYVRRAAEAQSWQISSDIAVERNPAQWLDKAIVDIAARNVMKVEVEPANGKPVRIERIEDDAQSDFRLLDVPKGREAAEGYTRDALAGVLSMLKFEDVFTAAAEPVPDSAQRATYTLDDGRSVDVRFWDKEGKVFSRFAMHLDEAAARVALERRADAMKASDAKTTEAETPKGDATTNAAPVIDVDAELAKLREQVERFGQEHGKWVYVLPAYKASNLRKGFDEYLKPRASS